MRILFANKMRFYFVKRNKQSFHFQSGWCIVLVNMQTHAEHVAHVKEPKLHRHIERRQQNWSAVDNVHAVENHFYASDLSEI